MKINSGCQVVFLSLLLLGSNLLMCPEAFTFPSPKTSRTTIRPSIAKRSYSSADNIVTNTRVTNQQCLGMTLASPEIVEAGEDEEEGIQETYDLIIDFVYKLDETAIGSLSEEDLAFIQPILKEIESISKVVQEESEQECGSKTLLLLGDEEDYPVRVQIAEMVEKLVGRLVDEWQNSILNDEEIDFEPDVAFFNMAMDAWTRSFSGSKNDDETRSMIVERVNSSFEEMKELYENGLENCSPNVNSFNAILRTVSCKKLNKAECHDEALEIYEQMRNMGILPNVETFELLISFIARSKEKNNAYRAEELLRQGVARFPPRMGSGIRIDSFNAVLAAWAKSDERGSSTKIEGILALMDENGIQPDLRSFTIYIDSFAQKKDWDSINESENILSRLVDLYLAGELDFEPDVQCWTTVIRGWMRLAKRRRSAAQRAERILERMVVLQDDQKITVQADAIVYGSVLNAWVYAGSMTDAGRILSTMEYLWNRGDENMKPTLRTYKILIEGWAKSSEEGAMSRAEELFKKVKSICDEAGDDQHDLFGDINTSMLFGYSKNCNPSKAEEILRFLVEGEYKLDPFKFDKVIEGYTSLGDPDEISKVYSIFQLMESCQKQGRVQANERLYTSIIRAIARESKPGMVKKSQSIIRRMQQLYENGNKNAKPSRFTYNALLKACAKSAELDEKERSVALNVALSTFKLLRSSNDNNTAADHVTYSTLIKCSHLLPAGDKRDNFVQATFSQCASSGMVNEHFVEDLEKYASVDLASRLLSKIK